MDQNHMLPRPADRPVESDSAKAPDLFDSLANTSLPPPPSYAQSLPQSQSHTRPHGPAPLTFPDLPTPELPPILPASTRQDGAPNRLPSLSSLTGPPGPQPVPAVPSVPGPSSMPTASSSSASRPSSSISTTATAMLPERPLPKPTHSITPWPSMNPFTTYYTPGYAQQAADTSATRMDVDAASTSNSTSTASPDRLTMGRSVSVSLDDPEVRMAAEALGDLRADFVSSPPSRNTPLPARSSAPSRGSRFSAARQSPQHEPLFSLLTTSHPLLATTVENATSAYNTSKNFSPRIKSSVEYVEGYLTPIANTVGSVGRATGVEGGVRWFLGAGRRHHQTDLEAEAGSNKRRKVDRGEETIGVVVDAAPGGTLPPATGTDSPRDSYVFTPDRRLSRASTVETLPAYDDARSPAYTEQDKEHADRPSSSSSEMRGSRLMVSTSGLAVAMSNESLRSLKYCLRWLRRANDRIGGVVTNLKTTLEQYEQAGASAGQDDGEAAAAAANGETMDVDGRGSEPRSPREDQTVLAARIAALKTEILRNLQAAIDTVSRYAGGALPENARALIHRQLTSLPQRFRYASMVEQQQQQQQGADGSPMLLEERTREGANRVLVLAKEGLDMITQVSGVIDGTIVSAEEWCDKLGTRREDADQGLPQSQIEASGNDTKTG